ncbi:MAG: hypothetical protein K9N23_01270, partial [Akkermansiaceae bacterium]|nr:hypothetical protein [Akkermansiaceae bacterium]
AESTTSVNNDPKLHLQVAAMPNPVRPGEQVEMTFTLSNPTALDLAGTALRFVTPAWIHWTPSDAAPSPDSYDPLFNPGEVARWDLGTLPAGTSRTILVSGAIDDGYYSPPPDGTLLPVTAVATAANGASATDSAHLIVGYPPPVYWPVASGGNGHFYRVVPTPQGTTWNEARDFAQATGGHLATINSAAENAFIYALVDRDSIWIDQGNSQWGPWLGGGQLTGSPEPSGGWVWVTGEPFAFQNWCDTEPNNAGGNQDRLYFLSTDSSRAPTWGDKNGGDTLNGFVVEYAIDTPALPQILSIRKGEGSSMELNLLVEPGVSYILETSIDLQHWEQHDLGGSSTDFDLLIRDLDAPAHSHRFYRLASPR